MAQEAATEQRAREQRTRTCIGCKQRTDPSSLVRLSLEVLNDSVKTGAQASNTSSVGSPSTAAISETTSTCGSVPAGFALSWPPRLTLLAPALLVPAPLDPGLLDPERAKPKDGLALGPVLGRGAYIHRSLECFLKAQRGNALEHAFRLPRGALRENGGALREFREARAENKGQNSISSRGGPYGGRHALSILWDSLLNETGLAPAVSSRAPARHGSHQKSGSGSAGSPLGAMPGRSFAKSQTRPNGGSGTPNRGIDTKFHKRLTSKPV